MEILGIIIFAVIDQVIDFTRAVEQRVFGV